MDVGILEGAVNNSANEEVAQRMRQRCKVLGGPGRLRGVRRRADAAQRRCAKPPCGGPTSKPRARWTAQFPHDPELAVMQQARPLDQVVKVDIHLPGCPPSAGCDLPCAQGAGPQPELRPDLDWHGHESLERSRDCLD